MSRDTTLDAERRPSPPGDFETAIARSNLPTADFSRPYPDGRAGLFLQCNLFHICTGLDRLLRRAGRSVGWYILPFAAGNFLGPLLLGRLFDTVGRKIMIGLTYAVSGVLLAGIL
jgi:MFS family permease